MHNVTQSGWVFDTDASAETTMSRMANMVKRAVQSDESLVRFADDLLAQQIQDRDSSSQASMIYDFIRRNLRYVSDPVGTQRIRPPADMLRDIQSKGWVSGNCVEVAVLAATFGEAVGLPARFRSLAFYDYDAPYTHVIADLFTSSGWFPIDATRPPGMLELPPVTRQVVREV